MLTACVHAFAAGGRVDADDEKEKVMTFPNGLPQDGEPVEVRTVWSGQWESCVFRGPVSKWWPEKGRYDWFGVFAKPGPNSLPIVLEWRRIT